MAHHPFERAGEPPGDARLLPQSAAEVSGAMAHYYRGEMARMTSWRDRLDRTTNWAIGAVAAMLSFALSSPTAHHGVLLFAMLLVTVLLIIEARRYRFFDLYRTRVRLFERHYYSPLFDPTITASDNWREMLGESLHRPQFSITQGAALSRRLRRNYGYIYLILLMAWLLKTTTGIEAAEKGSSLVFVHTSAELFANARLGYVPGWLVVAGVVFLHATLVFIMVRYRKQSGELAYGSAHV